MRLPEPLSTTFFVISWDIGIPFVEGAADSHESKEMFRKPRFS